MIDILPTLVFFLLGVCWFLSLRREATFLSVATLLAHGGMIGWLLASDGWTMFSVPTLFLMSGWLSGGVSLLGRRGEWSHWIPMGQGVICALSGLGTASLMDGSGPSMNPWAIPHVGMAVLWFTSVIIGSCIALVRLRGRRVGLLFVALVFSLIPMISPYSSMVQLHQDNQPLMVEATLHDSAGDTAIVRRIPALGVLPYAGPFRHLALGAILVGLAIAFVRKKAGRETNSGAVGLVIVGLVAMHTVLLSTALFPRNLEESHRDVIETARDRLLMEATTTEDVMNVVVASPPYSGGFGSYAPVVLSALSLLFVFLAYGRRDSPLYRLPSNVMERLEARVVAFGVCFWGLMFLTGCYWSDMVWGSFLIHDPKVYAQIIAGGLYILYFMVQRFMPSHADGPSWLLLALLLLSILSIMGPQLGLTAPTLHHYPG